MLAAGMILFHGADDVVTGARNERPVY